MINRKELICGAAAFCTTLAVSPAFAIQEGKKMKIRQIRNATLRVTFGGVEREPEGVKSSHKATLSK